jgi:hypothetical protein|tara:strand:+ start:80 stop:322 length:243 start_codon:yes stop_codon:yes gene_type:complete
MLSENFLKLLGYITFSLFILYILNKLLNFNNSVMLWALDSNMKEGMIFENTLNNMEKRRMKNKIKKKKIKNALIQAINKL